MCWTDSDLFVNEKRTTTKKKLVTGIPCLLWVLTPISVLCLFLPLTELRVGNLFLDHCSPIAIQYWWKCSILPCPTWQPQATYGYWAPDIWLKWLSFYLIWFNYLTFGQCSREYSSRVNWNKWRGYSLWYEVKGIVHQLWLQPTFDLKHWFERFFPDYSRLVALSLSPKRPLMSSSLKQVHKCFHLLKYVFTRKLNVYVINK